MDNKENIITLKQLTIFSISAQIGLGVLTLPSTLAKKIGHDGWIAVALSGCMIIILVTFIILLMNRYQNRSILDINVLLYGKYWGMFFNFIFICYLLFITGLGNRFFAEVIRIIVLNQTPVIIIGALVSIPTIYQTAKGLKVICRFATLLLLTHILLISTFLLVMKNARFTYLLPIGESGFLAIAKDITYAFYSFLGVELITIFYPNVTDKKSTLKHIITGITYVSVIYIIIVIFSTALFGENKLKMLVFPMYNIEQSIKVPILERLDIFFIVFWFPIMAGSVRSYFFSSYYCLSKIFKTRRKKLLIAIVFIIALSIGRIPKNIEEISIYMNYLGLLGTANILLMVFSFFISLVKRR
ncbi:spore germination protein (amino acid permease) [Clostridium tetanomorphum]|uniref:GerAB/ArcD/ProY family transporter n=1 Tax=Clostridium tetanomorphum TaxID=1553 RepID=A0A923E6T2_CLOTT|nr:GerAB/ArcD/ProY family transporter [Clostridium tetanomorphum]KAJ50257.1 spore germination permease [Clostridium tetanomorphum DSM 665]MBC2396186.1 GerAB/ArcD/ProY family transporter [Clostridium tetanomorphum]MBP1864398.1 spore germination protein (amino acid permease) [Clostridium tetanomorphum]NRS83844.1 spore germination protein (amino acid permease) [Clostridium tetanomorphum]NRZ97031.1 spore germination protein (amino acid permease) [Clostridium tetanomorphum]